jgi:hypothetical protein
MGLFEGGIEWCESRREYLLGRFERESRFVYAHLKQPPVYLYPPGDASARGSRAEPECGGCDRTAAVRLRGVRQPEQPLRRRLHALLALQGRQVLQQALPAHALGGPQNELRGGVRWAGSRAGARRAAGVLRRRGTQGHNGCCLAAAGTVETRDAGERA